MTSAETSSAIEQELASLHQQMQGLRDRMRELQKQVTRPMGKDDYILVGHQGEPVALSSLFGDKSDLFVVHNMGTGCAYCTLWADGLNSVLPYIEDRAAFVVISPDAPSVQQSFAVKRGWRFKMLSSQGSTFRADMGFQQGDYVMPGMSVLHKESDGTITHYSGVPFGPGDDYCALWHMFDLLPGGRGDWKPNYQH